VLSLINAIPDIINVLVVCFLFFLLFGIFGVNYFKGAFNYCYMQNIPKEVQELVTDKITCINYGGDWIRYDAHFDNVLSAMMTLLEISTTEGWLVIMYHFSQTVNLFEF
jgi:hypothetical protein